MSLEPEAPPPTGESGGGASESELREPLSSSPPPPAPPAFTPASPTQEQEPEEEWLDEATRRYVERQARRIAEEVVAPVLAYAPILEGLAEVLYDQFSRVRIQERLQQEDRELQGLISEEDIEQIKRTARERFGGNIDEAYELYTAGIRRTLQRVRAERPLREEETRLQNGKLTPGERLRLLAEQ